MCTGLFWKNLKETCHLKDGMDMEQNFKMNHTNVQWEGMDWIHLAQDRDRWQGFVNMAVNLQVSYNVGNFMAGLRTVGFLQGPCSLQ